MVIEADKWGKPANYWFVLLCLMPFAIYFKASFLYLPILCTAAIGLSWRFQIRRRRTVLCFLILAPSILSIVAYHFWLFDFTKALGEVKYYFGFFFFYVPLFLICNGRQRFIPRLLLVYLWSLSLTLILESILINYFPASQSFITTIPDLLLNKSHKTEFFGFYQRPYGLGTSFAESSALIAMILAFFAINPSLLDWRNRLLSEAVGIGAVVFSMSGTGFGMLSIYLLGRVWQSWSKKIVILSIAVIGAIPFLITAFPGFSDSSPMWKISHRYISYLLGRKLESVISVAQDFSPMEMWIGGMDGSKTSPITWSDFGGSGMFEVFGFFIFIVIGAFTATHLNRRNFLPLLMMLLSLLHYSAIFCTLGQVVFVLLLLYDPSQSELFMQKSSNQDLEKHNTSLGISPGSAGGKIVHSYHSNI